jgi:hypothetical protein
LAAVIVLRNRPALRVRENLRRRQAMRLETRSLKVNPRPLRWRGRLLGGRRALLKGRLGRRHRRCWGRRKADRGFRSRFPIAVVVARARLARRTA